MRRDGEAKGLGGLDVDDQLEVHGLLHGQLGWLGAFQDSVQNGIQLVSKCLLHQGLTQCPTWFRHEGEGFGPPLFDPGLDTVGPCGIDE